MPENTGEQTEPVLHKIWIEAEDAATSFPMVAGDDAAASGYGYVWVPEGSGNMSSPSATGGNVEVTFDVPEAGDYIVWGRVLTASGGDDSFFVSMDGAESMVWHAMQSGPEAWVWDPVSARDVGEVRDASNPYVYRLAAGAHRLVFSLREDGTKLDRLLITNDRLYLPVE